MELFGRYELLAPLSFADLETWWLARLRTADGSTRLLRLGQLRTRSADDPEKLERFLDQGRTHARLDHPNILRVIELGQIEGRYFVALEHVPALSLAYVTRGEPLPLPVARAVARQVSDAVVTAHEQRHPDGRPLAIGHGDFDLRQIYLCANGTVKIGGFGTQRGSSEDDERAVHSLGDRIGLDTLGGDATPAEVSAFLRERFASEINALETLESVGGSGPVDELPPLLWRALEAPLHPPIGVTGPVRPFTEPPPPAAPLLYWVVATLCLGGAVGAVWFYLRH